MGVIALRRDQKRAWVWTPYTHWKQAKKAGCFGSDQGWLNYKFGVSDDEGYSAPLK